MSHLQEPTTTDDGYTVAVASDTGTEFSITRADSGAITYTCDDRR